MAHPGDFAYTVKTSVDIVRVVGEQVRLKKSSGTRYMGLCPFHQEKTPSFSVHGQMQFYHCFGCGAHGDVFKFIMETQRLTFPEAVRALAERAGIPIPKTRSPENDPQARLRAQLYEIHERAAEFYRRQLEGTEGTAARHYLSRRGMTPELGAEFGLGYAPAGGQALVRLIAKDFPEEAQLESGLILKRDDGSGYFDRFRHRLIFPIHNEAGKVIAFGGRALRDEDQPKYLNSSETPIYRKSRVLYNMHRARETMRRQGQAILVEGYMDAIGVFSAGVANVVASCGTSLTLEHVKNLAPLVKTVVVNYDPDSAGVAATERSLNILLEENVEVRVVSLPGGQDPDDYIRAAGARAYRDQVEAAPSFFDYLVGRIPQLFDLGKPEGKAAAVRHVLQYVTKLPDRIVRVEMAGRLADRLGLDRDLLGRELRSAAADRRAAPTEQRRAAGSGVSWIEKALLRLLVTDGESRQQVLPEILKVIAKLPTQEIFRTLAAMSADDPLAPFDIPALQDRLVESDRQLLAEALMDETVEPINPEKVMTYVDDLARNLLLARIDELRGLIRKAGESGDTSEFIRLAEEKKSLERQIEPHYLVDKPGANMR